MMQSMAMQLLMYRVAPELQSSSHSSASKTAQPGGYCSIKVTCRNAEEAQQQTAKRMKHVVNEKGGYMRYLPLPG